MKAISRLLCIFTFLLLFHDVCSQQAGWQWINRAGGVGSHGTVTPDDRAYDMALDQYGNVYVCGVIYDSFFATFDTLSVKTYGEEDLFIAKYSCEGELLWVKVGGNRQGFDLARSISVDTTRQVVYVTGNLRSTNLDRFTFDKDTSFNTGHNDFFLMQLSYDGDLNRLFVGESVSGGLYHDLDSSGNVYGLLSIAGIPNGPFAPGYNLNSGYHLIKFDPNGNIIFVDSIWDRGIVTLTDIAVDKAGNSYITGLFKDTVVIGGQMLVSVSGLSDAFIMKYNSQGVFQWVRNSVSGIPSTFEFVVSNAVDINMDGSKIFLGGYGGKGAKLSGLTITNTLGSHTSAFIACYDSTGSIQWLNCSANSQSSCNGFGLSTNNKYEVFLSGGLTGNTTFNGTDFFTSEGQSDVFVMGFKDNGDLFYQNVLKGGGNLDYGYAIEAGYNGNFHVAGSFGYSLKIPGDTLYATGGNSDIFIARYGIEECLDTTKADTNDTTGIKEYFNSNYQILKLQPNPNNGRFTLSVEDQIRDGKLRIIDAMGKVVHTATIQQHNKATISIDVPNGIYLAILETPNKTYLQKLVIQRN